MKKGRGMKACLRLLPLVVVAGLLVACGGDDSDETAPALKFTGTDPVTTTRSHTLTGTVEPGATVTVTVDTTATVGTDTDPASDAWSYTVDNLAPGPNIVTIQAEDAQGNLTTLTFNLLYDALSIESWVSPIPPATTPAITTLTIGGLVGQFASPPTSFTATVVTPATASAPVITGDRWSSTLSGLVTGSNVVTLTFDHPGLAAPVVKTVTIDVNASAPEVTIDPPGTPAANMTVQGDRTSGVTVAVAAPTATVGTVDLTTDPLRWSCPLSDLDRGKNPFTAVATANGITAVAHDLIVLP